MGEYIASLVPDWLSLVRLFYFCLSAINKQNETNQVYKLCCGIMWLTMVFFKYRRKEILVPSKDQLREIVERAVRNDPVTDEEVVLVSDYLDGKVQLDNPEETTER